MKSLIFHAHCSHDPSSTKCICCVRSIVPKTEEKRPQAHPRHLPLNTKELRLFPESLQPLRKPLRCLLERNSECPIFISPVNIKDQHKNNLKCQNDLCASGQPTFLHELSSQQLGTLSNLTKATGKLTRQLKWFCQDRWICVRRPIINSHVTSAHTCAHNVKCLKKEWKPVPGFH